MLTAVVKMQNKLGEWTDVKVSAHSVPDLYHEIAERCTEFDGATCSRIDKIRIGEIVFDPEDYN